MNLHLSVINHLFNGLFAAGSLPDALAFHRGLDRVPSLQDRKLMAYLRANRDTVFGREYGFDRIRSAEAYRDRVPIADYEAFAPYIRRIAAGEPGILTRERVRLLEPTGGTRAGSKFIPYTASLQREFQAAVRTWILDLYRHFPGLSGTRSYWSVTPVTGERKTTPGGIPVGFDDDADYAGVLGRVLRRLFPVPPEVKSLASIENFRYVTAFHLLRARDLGLLSVWNPTFLLLLTDHIEQQYERLTRDLFDGDLRLPDPSRDRVRFVGVRPDRSRARELETAFAEGTNDRYRRLWPSLRLISCWADGASRMHAEKLAERFPGVTVQPKGLLATECVISFPLEEAGGPVIAYPAHYFEFLPIEGGRTRPLHRLDHGGFYTVVVTTGGGLYRYNLGDRIQVTGSWRGLPVVRFHDRSHVSDLVGEKLEEGHVRSVVERAVSRHGVDADFLLLAPEREPAGGVYTLFLQPRKPVPHELRRAFLEDVETGLCENYHYRYARRLGQLGPPRLWVITRGNGQEAYLRRCMEAGQRLGDIKQTLLDPRTGWQATFEGEPFPSAEDG